MCAKSLLSSFRERLFSAVDLAVALSAEVLFLFNKQQQSLCLFAIFSVLRALPPTERVDAIALTFRKSQKWMVT